MDDSLLQLLRDWIPIQRWYPRKGSAGEGASIRIAERFFLPSQDAGVSYYVLVVAVDFPDSVAPTGPLLLQVPVSIHRTGPAVPENLGDARVIGQLRAAAGDPGSWVCDGLTDPGFVQAWLTSLGRAINARTHSGTGSPDEELQPSELKPSEPQHSEPQPLAARMDVWVNPVAMNLAANRASSIRLIASEQSNSSVIFEAGTRSLISKFFRVLQAGIHPEQEIGQAFARLSAAGETLAVPALLAAGTVGIRPTTLFVIHEFISGASDGWGFALAQADAQLSFSRPAADIARSLAQLHAGLRQSLGSTVVHGAGVRSVMTALLRRLEAAWEATRSAVGPYDEQFQRLLAQLRYIDSLPPLQRIHGDLHLGQMLYRASGTGSAVTEVAGAGPAGAGGTWYILDFEGEPLRPLESRSSPDLALRDVVGVLRSFDYAGAQASANGKLSRDEGSRWAKQAAESFLRGYENASGEIILRESSLFMALWLDKALYEVTYELQNRPPWAWVPVNAVRELFESMESGVDMGRIEITPSVIDQGTLTRISEGIHYAPHSVLGAHLDGTEVNGDAFATIRTLRHLATSVCVITTAGEFPMTHEFGGIWAAVVPVAEPGHVPDYRLDVDYGAGPLRVDDPYRYLPTVGELDMHLIAEGRHETLWTVLGAHVRRYHSELGEVTGVSFAVWAPAVQAVRVIGGFNDWDGRAHAMRSLGTSGIWELFIPDVAAGEQYKFELLTEQGAWLQKADPMAFGTEVPPLTASRVVDSTYSFHDQEWMASREGIDPHNSPMSVYEVHLGSWRQGLSYLQLAEELVGYVKELGFTHVELMPVSEHPFGGSWGYQVTSYYAPTARFGHPDEFRHLVDALHQAGIGVIMDWVPAHFPKDEWALAKFNGGAQYEHANPQLGEHPDWGTLIFDFGRNEVRNFLVANALFWFEEFHIDGLRVDAVASMLYLDYSREDGAWSPNRFGGRENLEAISFLQEMNATAYRRNPGIVTIAEESTAFPGVTAPTSGGGLGFGIKWNMGWMHDSLTYMAEDPVNRGWHHNQITFSLVYAFTENFLLPISHDEVVHGKGSLLRKMPGDRWQQLANLRAYLAFQWAHPGKQLIFMGTEFAQEAEWSEQHGLDWWLAENPSHSAIQTLVGELNETYKTVPALYQLDNVPEGFTWLNGGDTENNVVSFVRWDKEGNPLVCIVNFAGVAYEGYRVGLPQAGSWREVLNTDAAEYGGSDVRNAGELLAEAASWDGQDNSVRLRIPPLGAIYLVPSLT